MYAHLKFLLILPDWPHKILFIYASVLFVNAVYFFSIFVGMSVNLCLFDCKWNGACMSLMTLLWIGFFHIFFVFSYLSVVFFFFFFSSGFLIGKFVLLFLFLICESSIVNASNYFDMKRLFSKTSIVSI